MHIYICAHALLPHRFADEQSICLQLCSISMAIDRHNRSLDRASQQQSAPGAAARRCCPGQHQCQ